MHAIAPPVSVIPEGAWNPGISSEIPTELLHLATIYCPENTFTNLRELRELAGISGLPMDKLVKPLLPFLAAIVVALLFVAFIPEVVLFVPRMLGFVR